MSMLDMLEKEVNKLNLFEGNIPEITKAVADSIPSKTIPYRMKLALAMSEIMLFISQFRINIKHWNGSSIPINSIMFCIAKSGASKDSSLKAARKCFEEAYKVLNESRMQAAIDRAIKQAVANGEEIPERYVTYKKYLTPPNPLFLAVSSTEGFIQHLNDLSDDRIGAGYIFSGEVGAELATNMNLTENIKVLAELYDEGSKEVKIIKARENQSREVKNLPVSALFIGSQDNILFDEIIKRKFKTEFTTKLARRSFFVYVNEEMSEDTFSSISAMLANERIAEDKAIKSRESVIEYINEITEPLLELAGTTVDISEEVRDTFSLYKKYNEAIANTIDSQFPIAKLTRSHLQWKALKLSGALALIQQSTTIELEHYKAAVEFVELINEDVALFEKELVKEAYELFADYVRLFARDGEYTISLHNLRKAGFIPMKGQSDTHMRELVKLVNSYDSKGTYKQIGDNIHFKEIVRTDTILLSYIECSGTKSQRAVKCNAGFQCEELTFRDLQDMLEGDYAYSPFKFVNGVRGKDNIDSGCKWIVLDVDTSEITDEEAHLLISDINHYVVRTSNKDNPNKFRVLIELDSEINLPDTQWKPFISAVTRDLGLVADGLPKSQVFFSYKDRTILSTLDNNPLEVKPYLDYIASVTSSSKPKKIPTEKACNIMLDDPLTTFDKAYNAKDGEGRRKLIWAARYARELGADRDYCKNLLDKITNYWVKGFPKDQLDNMKRQLDRWEF